MSGAGFDFEDLISAWLMVKILTGEQAPAIGGTGTKLQAQVDSLGWHIDDLLLTTQDDAGLSGTWLSQRRAINKSPLQAYQLTS